MHFTDYKFTAILGMADEPTEIGVWVREQVLGSGGFGVVTLWRNTEKGNLIGKYQ
jgi:hypothetical protein